MKDNQESLNQSFSSVNKRVLGSPENNSSAKRHCTPSKTKKNKKNLDKWNTNEEILYRVYSKIFEYSSCALAKVILSKTCLEIREYMELTDTHFINEILKYENENSNGNLSSSKLSTENNENSDAPIRKQNGSTKRGKKKKVIDSIKSHFQARKLHEEAKEANSNSSMFGNNLDESDSAGKVNNYHPCDHPGQPCNESCKCVRNG